MRSISIILLILLLTACANEAETNRRQNFAQGRNIYIELCSTCHGEEGISVLKNIPPLAGSDYFAKDKNRVACLIRYGMNSPIIVNGMPYHQKMPGFESLSSSKMAQLMTYSYSKFGNEKLNFTKQEVDSLLGNCGNYLPELLLD